MACRENIILRQIKQRNTNLLAREFAWFDHKFRPRLRRPYFNSFARDTQSILVLTGMSSAYLISGSIPGTNPEVSRVSHMTNLVPRVFSLSNMAAAGKKTLAHSELKRSLIGVFHCAFIRALSLVYSFQNKDDYSLSSS